MFLIFLLSLRTTLTQEIKLESLNDGPGILPFKLGTARIITHYHSFLRHINLDDIEDKINSVNNQLSNVSPELHNQTKSFFEPHITYLKSKLDSVLEQLGTFRSNRAKRGLIDGLGSVIKSVTGNLDYTDAMHYNEIIKTLQDNQNNLVNEFNTQISLSQNFTHEYSKIIDNIVNNQEKLSTLLQEIDKKDATRDFYLVKYAHLAQVLMILSDNVDLISQELLKLQNNLAFIRTSTAHHSVLQSRTLHAMIDKLNQLYTQERIIDLDLREYFDVIRLGSYYIGNEIVIVYKFPIVFPPIYDLYKLAIIPNKQQQILTPPFPYLALHKKEFKYIEAECPKTSKYYLCTENHSMQSQTSEDCIQQLITTQQRNAILCNYTSVTMDKPAYEELDERHYTISFPTPTKVHLACSQHQYETLQGSYLAIIPHQCRLETVHFTILNANDRLRGQALKIMDLPKDTIDIKQPGTSVSKLNSINLDNLHQINSKISLQSPVKLAKNEEHSLYHTTIPMYATLLSACALVSVLYWRKRCMKQSNDVTKEGTPQLQAVYALPSIARVDSEQPPAQFTTKVFNSRCSSGGGVTQDRPT